MAWQKSPPELIALFDTVLPGPPVERRQMFGYPSAFVNGNLFMGLFENMLALRLPPFERDALLRTPGAAPFAPMPGRPMREYVTMPQTLLIDGPALRGWVDKALEYARSLPPKTANAAPEEEIAPARAKPKAERAAARKPARKAVKRTAKPKRAVAAAERPIKKAVKKSVRKVAKKSAKAKRAVGAKARSAAKAVKAKRPSAKRKTPAKRPAVKRKVAAKRKTAARRKPAPRR